MAETPYAIEMQGITKRFGKVVANRDITFAVRTGEVHAVIGENGAGKTTLMNILFGLLQPDEGTVKVAGEPVHLRSPKDAIRLGLGMVHQHFKLVPSLTAAENIFLGIEPQRYGLIDRDAAIAQVHALSERYGLRVEPTAIVRHLPVGIEQRIEILKVLVRGARIIILDEPTAVLTPQERRELFRILNGFVADGMTVIFISHHLEEVMEVSATTTVLRQGEVVDTRPTASLSKSELVRMMVGKDISFDRPAHAGKAGDPILEVSDLWARDDRGLKAVRDVSFEVRAHEIVGIAGVAGNGQGELAEVISGLRLPSHGAIRLNGTAIDAASPRAIRDIGLAHVPADRMERGVDRDAPIRLNMLMGRHHKAPWSRHGWLNSEAITATANDLVKRFDVRTDSVDRAVKTLSGGNIQKTVVAREFSQEANFLLVDQPTRGVDIGAMTEIHDEILRRREAGQAILLFSVQLDEILTLADRILVMFEGEIIGEVDPTTTTEEEIGLLMAGVRGDAAATQGSPGLPAGAA